MLSNEKWGLSENGQTLIDAANYMDEHGWCQGAAGMPDGGVCLYGAIAAVTGAVNSGYGNRLLIDTASPNFARFVAIQNLLESKERFPLGAAYWNDKVAKSKEEVVAKLRELAYLF